MTCPDEPTEDKVAAELRHVLHVVDESKFKRVIAFLEDYRHVQSFVETLALVRDRLRAVRPPRKRALQRIFAEPFEVLLTPEPPLALPPPFTGIRRACIPLFWQAIAAKIDADLLAKLETRLCNQAGHQTTCFGDGRDLQAAFVLWRSAAEVAGNALAPWLSRKNPLPGSSLLETKGIVTLVINALEQAESIATLRRALGAQTFEQPDYDRSKLATTEIERVMGRGEGAVEILIRTMATSFQEPIDVLIWLKRQLGRFGEAVSTVQTNLTREAAANILTHVRTLQAVGVDRLAAAERSRLPEHIRRILYRVDVTEDASVRLRAEIEKRLVTVRQDLARLISALTKDCGFREDLTSREAQKRARDMALDLTKASELSRTMGWSMTEVTAAIEKSTAALSRAASTAFALDTRAPEGYAAVHLVELLQGSAKALELMPEEALGQVQERDGTPDFAAVARLLAGHDPSGET